MAYSTASGTGVNALDARTCGPGRTLRILFRSIALGAATVAAAGLIVASVMVAAGWVIGVSLRTQSVMLGSPPMATEMAAGAHPYGTRAAALDFALPPKTASDPAEVEPSRDSGEVQVSELEASQNGEIAPASAPADTTQAVPAPHAPQTPVAVADATPTPAPAAKEAAARSPIGRIAVKPVAITAPLARPAPKLAAITAPVAPPAPKPAAVTAPVAPPAPNAAAIAAPVPKPAPATAAIAAAITALPPAPASLPAPAPKKPAQAEQARNNSIALADADGRTAVYDIAGHTVYLPNGERLEAHSGLGRMMDDPHYVSFRMRGATPPNTYKLVLREQIFHGVRAIRLIPAGEGKMYGRDGILAHTYMLGPNGQSNGCVSFRNYPAFLHAFLKGDVQRLVVVAHLSTAPAVATRSRGSRTGHYAYADE